MIIVHWGKEEYEAPIEVDVVSFVVNGGQKEYVVGPSKFSYKIVEANIFPFEKIAVEILEIYFRPNFVESMQFVVAPENKNDIEINFGLGLR